MHISDDTIKQIAEGSVGAFKELYDSFFPFLASFAYQLVKDTSEASDIVQEAFLVYWNKRTEFSKPDGVKAFMYKVIKNQGLNYLRDQQAHSKHHEFIRNNESFYFKDKIIEEETKALVLEAVKDLPPQTKNIVELSMKGIKNKEVAESLKISVNTVKTLKLRAFQMLREKLKDHVLVLIILSELLLG